MKQKSWEKLDKKGISWLKITSVSNQSEQGPSSLPWAPRSAGTRISEDGNEVLGAQACPLRHAPCFNTTPDEKGCLAIRLQRSSGCLCYWTRGAADELRRGLGSAQAIWGRSTIDLCSIGPQKALARKLTWTHKCKEGPSNNIWKFNQSSLQTLVFYSPHRTYMSPYNIHTQCMQTQAYER